MKTIKFLFPVLMLAFAVSFSSCSNDPEDLIVGTWVYENSSYDVQAGNAADVSKVKESLKESDAEENGSLTFNADGTCSVKTTAPMATLTLNGTYKFENGKLVIKMDIGDEPEAFAYTLNKNKLSIIGEYSESQLRYEEYLLDNTVKITKIAVTSNYKKK